MSKIIIVSLRVAQQNQPSTGGLAIAIECMLKKNNLCGVWLGWNGEISSSVSKDLEVENRNSYTAMTFSLTQEQYEEFYCGYANNCLWPAFHYRLDLMRFSSHEFQQYLTINKQIAHYLRTIVEPEDIIWVQDYHLIPLGKYCRDLGIDNSIGFFLHTPFPCAEILKAIPKQKQWLPSLLSYDVVGLQSELDYRSLTTTLKDQLNIQGHNHIFEFKQRFTCIRAYPISIDPNLIQDLIEKAIYQNQDTNDISFIERKTIISVDRLDYSKGLTKRFETFETFLNHYPILKEEVNYIQIAPNTRTGIETYQTIREELESLAGQINGKHSTVDWNPITYINRAFSPSQLMLLFRKSRVGYVAPLRDGMNLVAKEYITAQDPTDPGVLVLSKFTGAAQELKEGALLINPFDMEETAHALFKALQMPLEERKTRHQSLLEHIKQFDLQHWCDTFLADLSRMNNSKQQVAYLMK